MHMLGLPALFEPVWQLIFGPLISGGSLPRQGGFGACQPWTAARAEKRLSHITCVPGGCWSCWSFSLNLNCEELEPILRQWETLKCWIFPFHGAGSSFAPPPVAVPNLCLSRVSEDVGGVLVWKLRLHRCWQSPLRALLEPLAKQLPWIPCVSAGFVRLGWAAAPESPCDGHMGKLLQKHCGQCILQNQLFHWKFNDFFSKCFYCLAKVKVSKISFPR